MHSLKHFSCLCVHVFYADDKLKKLWTDLDEIVSVSVLGANLKACLFSASHSPLMDRSQEDQNF